MGFNSCFLLQEHLLVAEELKLEMLGSGSLQVHVACSEEQESKDLLLEDGLENPPNGLGSKLQSPGKHSLQREDSSRDVGQSDKQGLEVFTGTEGRKLLEEISRDDPTLTVPWVRREVCVALLIWVICSCYGFAHA